MVGQVCKESWLCDWHRPDQTVDRLLVNVLRILVLTFDTSITHCGEKTRNTSKQLQFCGAEAEWNGMDRLS